MKRQRILWSSISIYLISVAASASDGKGTLPTQSGPLPVDPTVKCLQELVKIPESGISEIRLLSREMDSGNFKHTRMMTFPMTSRIWETKCPVTLSQIGREASKFCQTVPVFRTDTTIAIAPLLNGRYLLHAEKLNLPYGGNLGAVLVPHSVDGTSPRERHVGWLKSEMSTLPDFDFYVLITTDSSNLMEQTKHVQIEAFHRHDTECDAHRPENSFCAEEHPRSSDPSRQRCPNLRQEDPVFKAFEAHTGGGNETIGIP